LGEYSGGKRRALSIAGCDRAGDLAAREHNYAGGRTERHRLRTFIFFDRFTPHFDQHGNFTGGTDLSGDSFGRGASVSVGKLLSSAKVTAHIAVRRCTITASGNETGCTRAGSITITLTFTGVGPTARGGSNDHFHYPGVTITDHMVGTQRQATVTGTIAGQHVIARDLQEAIIGHLKGGGLFACHGC